MITFTVAEKYNNLKIGKLLSILYPQISYSTFCKLLRKKDIKINGKRISENINIFANDIIEVYFKEQEEKLSILYEDNNIIAVNKPQGMEVLKSTTTSLLDLVQKYLKSDIVYPCHRLDRNTGGIVLFAKSNEALKILEELIRKEKNFARADEIRNELLEKGIALEDTREGVKWKMV